MDFNDFIQENKRWLLGCVVGLLVYYIAWSIVEGRTERRSYVSQISNASRKIREEQYRRPQLEAARKDATTLEQQLEALRSKMVFQVPERFSLENKPDPQLHLQKILAAERRRLRDLTYQNNIELSDKAFDWQPPTDRAQIEEALVAAALVVKVTDHLIAAHQKSLEQDYGSYALRSIQSFQPGRSRKSTNRFRGRNQKARPSDYLQDVQLTVKFEADSRCLHHLLEALRADPNPVTLRSLKSKANPSRPGDPMAVEMVLAALQLKPLTEEEQ